MALPTYSSRKVSANWAGYGMEDFTPDSFITFSLNTDLTDEEVGADGNVAISISPDETGTCTLSFQQGGKGDQVLSGVLELQRQNDQLVKGDMVIKDPSGSMLALIRNAHIKIAPEVDYGSTATGKGRSYTFFAEQLHFVAPGKGAAEAVDGQVASVLATMEQYLS